MPLNSQFPDHVIVPESLNSYILKHLPEYEDGIAIIDRVTGRSYTFRDVLRISKAVAHGLRTAGARKGDVIMICTRNCPEFIFCLLGALQIGVITTAINPYFTEDEIVYYLNDSGAKFMLTDPETYPTCKKAASHSSIKTSVTKIFITGTSSPEGAASFEELVNFRVTDSVESNSNRTFGAINPRLDVAVLPYSSGTTGKPKGVMLSHFNVVAELHIIGRPFFMVPEEDDTFIGQLPFYHIFGFEMMLLCLKCGTTMVTMPRYDPNLFLQTIQQYRAKIIAVPPPIFLFLANDPLIDNYDIRSVQSVWVGSAPIGKHLTEKVQKRHQNIKYIIQGYGMTEGTAASHLCPPLSPDLAKHGSCGMLLPNLQCMVVDVESGVELGPHKQGEIWVRSPANMIGYWNKPKETAETIDADRWLHTGDLGYYDDDGYFYIVDRLKELIKVSGFQVAPAELEALLLTHAAVKECGVIGIPDQSRGEIPFGFVVLKDETNTVRTTAAELMQFVAGKVAAYKKLRKVLFIDAIPRALSGKILRRELRQLYQAIEARSSKL